MVEVEGEVQTRVGQPEPERQIPLTKALIVIAIVIVIIIVIGLVIGYAFFWNNYEQQTFVDVEMQAALQQVKDAPDDATAHLRLGYVYLLRGDVQEAMKEYQEAYRLDPKNRQVKYNLALGYMAGKQYGEAIKLLEPLAAEGLLDFEAHFSLAEAYYESGQYDKAVKEFQNTVAIRPGAADAYYYMGLAYEKMGDKEKALESFNQALRFVPNYQEALEAKARLQEAAGGGNTSGGA
ncbi:MAG: tetratricopeptide repeat protein [Clostridia bacterium]|nr:MAG: tetratricopeptide repeat protein [Clostridia bacterium]